MRVERLFAVAATALIGCSTAAVAQDNPYGGGTRLTGPPPAEIPTSAMSAEDKERFVIQDLAACLIKRHRSSVLKALQPEPWEPGARKTLYSVIDGRCLGEELLEVSPGLMRGAFYVEFYREAFASGPPTLPTSAFDFAGQKTASLTDSARDGIALLQFGDCVVRRDLKDAHALVLSRPGSPSEDAALSGLAPHFSLCLIHGSNWILDRSSVSAILGEVLYREGMEGRKAGM